MRSVLCYVDLMPLVTALHQVVVSMKPCDTAHPNLLSFLDEICIGTISASLGNYLET